MPRTCTICIHPEREAIDKALVSGQAYRSAARRFGASPPSVYRHQQDHLPAMLVRAAEAEDTAHGSDLYGQMVDLQQAALGILAAAEEAGDHRTALMALREVRGTLELMGKVTGELVHKVDHSGAVSHMFLPGLTTGQLRALVAKAQAEALELGIEPLQLMERQAALPDGG